MLPGIPLPTLRRVLWAVELVVAAIDSLCCVPVWYLSWIRSASYPRHLLGFVTAVPLRDRLLACAFYCWTVTVTSYARKGCSYEINSHKVISHKINSHEINSHKINFSRDQFRYDKLLIIEEILIMQTITKTVYSQVQHLKECWRFHWTSESLSFFSFEALLHQTCTGTFSSVWLPPLHWLL